MLVRSDLAKVLPKEPGLKPLWPSGQEGVERRRGNEAWAVSDSGELHSKESPRL